MLSAEFYPEAKVEEFLDSLPDRVRTRVGADLLLLEECGHMLGPPKVKKLTTDGLYEVRTLSQNHFVRLIFFYMGDRAIVVNGFKKKTGKTPRNEIEKATRWMQKIRKEN